MKFRVIAFLFFISLVSGFAQQSDFQDDWYMGKPIRDIIFSGLRNISQSELEALMNPYKGRLFDDNIFWEIQGKLYALEYFDRIEPATIPVNPSRNEVVIRFTVTERPIVSRVIFTGNSGLRRRELQDVITTKVNDIYNRAKIRVDIDAIINKYLDKGYPNAVVVADEVQAADGNMIINFRITEGDKITISRIEFLGNTKFSSNRLRSQISLKQKSLTRDGAFSEAKLIADIETLVRYYQDSGYIDAAVRDVTRSYTTDDKGTNLILTFLIEEGNEFTFGGITFEGNVIFTDEQLGKLVTSKVGDVVSYTRLEMDLQRVADIYFENGYIFNSIIRTPHKNYQDHTISYIISIIERSRAYIESITVIGNNKTKEHVITREIPLEPGDVFSRTKVLQAMQSLYNLQYFSMIIPDTLQGSSENLMDLVFTVEEQMTTNIQIGLTFSGSADPDSFPISGLIEWTDRNFFGTGNEVGIKLNSSIVDTTEASLNYMHRWAFGLPLSLGADFTVNFTKRLAAMANQNWWFNGDEPYAYPDGFSSYEEYERNNKLPPSQFLMDYEQLFLSLGLSTGYRWLTPAGIFGINGGIRFGLIRNQFNPNLRPFDPILRGRNDKWTPRNSFWFSLSLDQRDIFYDPSKGFYLLERMAIFGLFSEEREHYVRNDNKAQYFLTMFDVPVTDNWNFKGVLAVNFGISFIFKQVGRPLSIEDANKLAIDGMFVGRGWGNDAFRNKGFVLLDTWLELRFPLVRGLLAFDLFFDAAGVETKEGYYFGKNPSGDRNFTIENMRFSLGFGFRFTIPQFPIRISLAKRFKVVDDKVEWQTGAIGGRSGSGKGMDLVISFVLPY